jgi:hypothetical protein
MTISEAPVASGTAGRIPLTLNQEFLCAFDKGTEEGAFGDRHTLTYGWRIRGDIDVHVLQAALDDVCVRHEVLRTTIVRAETGGYQVVHPPSRVRLEIRDLTRTPPAECDVRAEELINELDAARYRVTELPLLRAVLGRFDDDEAVLVLVTHHVATDAWSMQILMRDLASRYAVRRGFREYEPPAVTQYQEFAVWQQGSVDYPQIGRAREYWRDKLRGAEILALPTDRPRTGRTTNSYAVTRFVLDVRATAAILQLANSVRSSPFMVLMAAYAMLLRERTGATDVVVPTFTSGRYEERFLRTAGPFFNFLPLRMDLAGCGTFREVVERTRRTCLEAYSNDIPFPLIVSEAPDLVRPFADPTLSVFAFELLQAADSMDDERIGDLRYTEVRRRVLPQALASDIPDGALWALDILPSAELAGSLKYNSSQYDEATVVALVSDYCRVLRSSATDPDAPLRSAATAVGTKG